MTVCWQGVVPFVVGRRMTLSPVAVFIMIIVLGWMWGAVGAMIAVPLLILVYTFGQHIPVLSPLASLIGPTEGDVDDDLDSDDVGSERASAEAAPKVAAS